MVAHALSAGMSGVPAGRGGGGKGDENDRMAEGAEGAVGEGLLYMLTSTACGAWIFWGSGHVAAWMYISRDISRGSVRLRFHLAQPSQPSAAL